MKKVIPGKIKTQLRLDGYYNVLNKYGTQHDSTEYYQWATGAAVTDAELADLYAGNGLFSTIIDAPADDATKNGIDLGIKDKDLQKRLDDHLQTIHYQSKLAKALKWARLFGGSAVVMLVDDGRLLQDPLNWRDVHGVEELLVYGRNEVFPLWINGYENNPDDENYRKGGTGIPEFYQIKQCVRQLCSAFLAMLSVPQWRNPRRLHDVKPLPHMGHTGVYAHPRRTSQCLHRSGLLHSLAGTAVDGDIQNEEPCQCSVHGRR